MTALKSISIYQKYGSLNDFDTLIDSTKLDLPCLSIEVPEEGIKNNYDQLEHSFEEEQFF